MNSQKVEHYETLLDREDIEELNSRAVIWQVILGIVIILGGYLSYLAYTKDTVWFLVVILAILISKVQVFSFL